MRMRMQQSRFLVVCFIRLPIIEIIHLAPKNGPHGRVCVCVQCRGLTHPFLASCVCVCVCACEYVVRPNLLCPFEQQQYVSSYCYFNARIPIFGPATRLSTLAYITSRYAASGTRAHPGNAHTASVAPDRPGRIVPLHLASTLHTHTLECVLLLLRCPCALLFGSVLFTLIICHPSR